MTTLGAAHATGSASPPQGYAAEAILHQGTMITVRRARRVSDGQPVVMKGPSAGRASPRAIARLRHEVVITREIAHPGVLRILDVEESDGGPVLVLEDFGGASLDIVLRSNRLSLAMTLRIGIHVADALASLHHAGVIHKDVKPHNILVRLDPLVVKLSDFGIATRLSQEAPRAESPDAAEGTLAYMSPEQTGWMNRSLDCRTDLYSLGVTLYEMLTGAPPFTAPSAMELVHCHLARTPTPPHAASAEIPRVVSDLVMKLLSKAAEDRYPCAEALRADLEECLRRYEADGRVDPFPLGERDAGGRLWLPEKLYGREAETQAVVAACERAAAGAVELLLISGHAGVGKSALVREVYKVLARRPGYFVSGKFGQLKQRTPYAAIAQAFGELCERMLSEGEEPMARWKARLSAALGSIGQVVVDVIPEIERVVGPQPAVQPLGPNESKNRFSLAFQTFVRAVTEEHLLVLFIDDLQWADPASLKLLDLLMTDPGGRGMLVIGAYRDQEVDDAHPLARLVRDLRAANAPASDVWLGPLEIEDIRRLLADALRCRLEDTDAFAALILERTAGNPFFIHQLLHALAGEGIVRFDPAAGAWAWSLERARSAEGAEGVVELMSAKIRRLAPGAQRAIRLAACVGHRFDLRTLALVAEQPPGEVAAALWDALREGLIVPLDPEYRFVHAGDAAVAGRLLEDPSFRVSYRFLHDRVQQAAYALIDEPERKRLHHRIGRLLAASLGEDPSDEELFVVVGHLNVAAALIEGAAERGELVRLNLAAGRRAQAATAYDAAFGYLSAAVSALGPDPWAGEPGLAFDVFDIHAAKAECAHLSGRCDEAEALFDALLERAASDVERARLYCMRMVLYNAQHRWADTLAVALQGLRLFGMEVPTEGEALAAALRAELAEAERGFAARRGEDVGAGPELADPRVRVVVEMLGYGSPSAYFLNPPLAQLLAVRMANLSLRHGSSPMASVAYVYHGFYLAAFWGQPHEGYRIVRMGVALNDRYRVDAIRAKLDFNYGVVMNLSRPQREPLEALQRARVAGMETGDFMFASASSNILAQMKLSLEGELRRVREDVGGFLRFTSRTKDALSTAVQTVARQVIQNLEGRTLDRGTLSDAGFDEDALVPKLEAVGFAIVAGFYYTNKLALAYLYGDHEGALRMARRANERARALTGQYIGIVDLPLYTCLTILALGPRASGEEGGALAEMLASSHDKLAVLARNCPELRHLELLVRAERARVAGEALEPILELYQQASDAAEQAGYVRYRALVSELCGRFLASRRVPWLARSCLVEAYQAYARWGATAKLRQMEEAYVELLPRAAAGQPASADLLSNLTSVASSTTEMAARRVALLDAAALIRAAQAVAREIDLGRVMARLLRLAVESVGAQRGALILDHEGGPRVEAVVEDEGEVRVGPSTPVRESGAAAARVIELAMSAGGAVVVADAAQDARLDGDPYVAARKPRSVLALPMVSQGEVSGILYLENNAAPDVFSPARLDVLELVAAQAAIAVNNALLYARVQAASDELRRANDALEAAVAARTAELSSAMARLEEELAERARAEQERAGLQEDLIRVQRERLAELSTPLIPITDRVMVMPLIGTMDAQRADEALAAALRGVSETGAQVVILDITGVRGVDSSVAATLLRTAAALRLLGAEAVITGIGPRVSQTLVGLDIDLGGTVVQGTLQRGIAYAIRRTGEAPRLGGRSSGGRP
ncbi:MULTISPECIES: protein kinase domain-containing protein [Sorangium]|uniref:Serine/threonine protein kinase n=1 Tax=Sorangium cellulosum TaxID=56 RepID=A0A4P2QMZ8_SORCE|nr:MULTISPECIES: AAA family ATPase [Sorangium]AUX31430.1 serine/threonine protein kinase [Sorangium cellulosum]WCQ90811.1 serine-threonine kinase [Sorangium sp. Soce836]